MEIISLTFAAVTMIGMWFFARWKGFNPWYWFLAAGLLGLTLLIVLPGPNQTGIDPMKAKQRIKLGNRVGIGMTLFALIIAATLFFIPIPM